VEKTWRNAKFAKELGVHVEITTLMLKGYNSREEIIKNIGKRIHDELGPSTPYHLTRFFPHYKSPNHGLITPTPLKFLERGHEIAKEQGLNHVYLGNTSSREFETTWCPNCSKPVIRRGILNVQEDHTDDQGRCRFCGEPICIK
jgi:pyruvate formate lyase activating enzyme